MSVVACKVYKDKYVIAADSIIVRGWTQSKGQNHNYVKLKEVNDIIIGSTGTAEESSLLFLYAMNTRPAGSDENSILAFMGDFSKWKNDRTGSSSIDNSYILAYKDKVYNIEGWFINEITQYEAIGAGMDYALAALHLGKTAEEAVETGIELSAMCESPVIRIERSF